MINLISRFKIMESYIFYRLFLICYSFYSLAIVFDMRWHTLNPIRDHYFITPHVLLYLGVVGMIFSFLCLKLKGHKISYWVFILFPLMSLFDDFWHTYFGVELASSPLMFWSPAHFSIGLIALYLLYQLYKTHVEPNTYIVDYLKVAFWIKFYFFFRYILVPISPFTKYLELQNYLNILSPVFLFLLIMSIFKFSKDYRILFPFLILASTAPTDEFRFLIHSDYVYNTNSIIFFLFTILFLFIILQKFDLLSYLVVGELTIIYIFFLQFISRNIVDIWWLVYSICVVPPFVYIYFLIESKILGFINKKNLFQDFVIK